MISKEMYELLKLIPRHPKSIPYQELEKKNIENLYDLVREAAYGDCEYIIPPMKSIKQSNLSITEKGQSAIEEYSITQNNQKVAKLTLTTSIVAIILSVISIIVAVVSALGSVQ